MWALDLARQGWTQCDIAVTLGASKGAVGWSTPAGADRKLSVSALLQGPSPGSARNQFRLNPAFLWHRAEAYGFRGDVWTCGRVAGVLQEEFGVSYCRSQMPRPLKRLGWSPQVPHHPRDPAGRGGH